MGYIRLKSKATKNMTIRRLTLSCRIFWTMKVATVFDSSLPISIVRRQRGMISVDSRKLMTSVSSTCEKQESCW